MLKRNLPIILFVCVFSSLYSQNDIEEKELNTKHALGLALSGDGGVGLSYRYLQNKLGFQINVLPIHSKEIFFQSTGLSFLYRFKETEKIEVYGYFGNHLINFNPFDEGLLSIYNAGLGAGVNIKFLDHMSFQFQGGYAVYNLLRSGSDDISGSPFSFLSIGVGLHYNF